MAEQGHGRVQPLWGVARDSAPTVLAQLRQQVTRYADVPVDPGDADPGAGEAAVPLSLGDLPAEMQQLVLRYQDSHRTDIEPIRLLSVGGPGDVGIPFIDADLPGNEDLVLLVLTETAASSEHVDVRSQLLVARRQTR
jgi:hypothetical protein